MEDKIEAGAFGSRGAFWNVVVANSVLHDDTTKLQLRIRLFVRCFVMGLQV